MAEMIGYWRCIHCEREHWVMSGGTTGCISMCGDQWISVLPSWVYQKPVDLHIEGAQINQTI